MTSQGDLFTYVPPAPTKAYPDRPGFRGKKGGTSHRAAEKLERSGRDVSIADRILNLMQTTGASLTADEIANRLREEPGSVRPRVTQLGQKRLLVRTGEERPTKLGAMADVWRAAVIRSEIAQ